MEQFENKDNILNERKIKLKFWMWAEILSHLEIPLIFSISH